MKTLIVFILTFLWDMVQSSHYQTILVYRDILQIHHHTERRSHIYICHYSLLHNDQPHMLQQKTLLINLIYFFNPYRESTCMHQDLSPRFFPRLNHLRNFRESRHFTYRTHNNVQFTICMDYLHQYLLIGSCQLLQSEGIALVKVQQLQTNESYDKHSLYLIVPRSAYLQLTVYISIGLQGYL